ncbi:MAG: hypothetical protein IKQ24_00580 [Verrucomicrobia bacterium]|nr:hypothetical protein [Lachnospiraceae bacterium]MBR4248628.1 hypothetical protein [Verrucomicrobiota bacterium]
MLTVLRILLIVAVILVFLCAPIIFFSRRNKASIQRNIEEGLRALKSAYQLTPVDAGEFQSIRLNALMKFDVSQYRIEELGNLSIMTVDSGVMQMLSFVVTPFEKNMPLLSNDFIYVLGGQRALAEFYDLVSDPGTAEYQAILSELKRSLERYAPLPDLPMKEVWYADLFTVRYTKQISDLKVSEQLFADSVASFVRQSAALPLLSKAEQPAKKAAVCRYTEGLLTNGGPSTSVFLNALGEEKTRRFFENVMFGTGLYE